MTPNCKKEVTLNSDASQTFRCVAAKGASAECGINVSCWGVWDSQSDKCQRVSQREIQSGEGRNGFRTLCECHPCVLRSSKMSVVFNTVSLKEQRQFEAV